MNRTLVAALLFLLLLPSTSHADPAAPGAWAISAGLTTSTLVGVASPGLLVGGVGQSPNLGGISIANPLGSSTVQPRLSLMLERRLAPQLWLLFQAQGSVSNSTQDMVFADLPASAQQGGATTEVVSRSRSLTLQAGPRFVISSSGPVELSAFVLGGWTRMFNDFDITIAARQNPTPEMPTPPADVEQRVVHSTGGTTQVGASIGLAAERSLLDALSLRISASLLNLSWTRETTSSGGNSQSKDLLSAGLVFVPSLDLRLSF